MILISLLSTLNLIAGTIMTQKEIESVGLDNLFTQEQIDRELFSRIDGKSWKSNTPLSLDDLRYIRVLHCNADGKPQIGELIVNKSIAEDILEIFRELYESGYRIERMVLVDDYDADDIESMNANNSSSFNTRFIAGTNRLSKHGLGTAIDINPLYNPWVKVVDGKTLVSPESAAPYATNRENRSDIPFKIDQSDLAYKLFTSHSFTWGGSWTTLKDFQHFEK